MERALAKELKDLAMEGCRFAVAFETREDTESEVVIGGGGRRTAARGSSRWRS